MVIFHDRSTGNFHEIPDRELINRAFGNPTPGVGKEFGEAMSSSPDGVLTGMGADLETSYGRNKEIPGKPENQERPRTAEEERAHQEFEEKLERHRQKYDGYYDAP
jgi:hypothetical protein